MLVFDNYQFIHRMAVYSLRNELTQPGWTLSVSNSMPDQNQVLLQTKLHQPPIIRGLIDRPALVEQLNNGIDYPITLVIAPAGYGKTTLICTWLYPEAAGQGETASSLPSAWLSLDDNDSDLNIFLRYVIAALRSIFSDACETTLMLLQANRQLSPAVLYTTFCNELEELPGEVILVLDDYQFIHGDAVHNLLVRLGRHWPKPLHLVLISRIDPPLPLPSLRAKGMIREFRTQHLRFSSQETTAYLSQAQFASLNQKALHILEERFEGWPAGLHLAALSLRSASSQESILSALSSEDANITGYLLDEVLTQQLPAIHSFLLKTSVLDRFCAALCEEIIEEVDDHWNVRACLDWIEHSDLFLIPLDNRREWYRYHHLFQELLQQRLSAEILPEEVARLHRLASAWFEKNGLLDEALHHALIVGDLDLAARQMVGGLRDAVNLEDRPTLDRWLRMLPEEMIQRHPGLLMIKVWSLQFSWRFDLLAKVLQQVEELLDTEAGTSLQDNDLQILRGQILLHKAQKAYFTNQATQAIEFCYQALALLPSSWTFGRGAAMLFLGLSMQASGEGHAAEQLLLDEYASYGRKTDVYALLVLEFLAYIYLHTGQLEQTKQIANLLVQGAIHSGIAMMKSLGDWFLSLVCYQRNELEEAAQYCTQIFENRFTAHISAYRDAVAGLALIHQIKGESSEAWQMVEAISQFDLEQSGREDDRTRSLRARLMLLDGDLEGASRWVDAFTNPPLDQPFMWLEEPRVTRVRILVARCKAADLRLALQILDDLDTIAERTHNTRYKIEILALRALALNCQSETSQANAALKEAIELSRPDGFIRVFVDLGTPCARCCPGLPIKATRSRRSAPFWRHFRQMRRIGMAAKDWLSPRLANRMEIRFWLNLLSARELEVLALLRGPLSIKEIASKLNISSATVKSHTIKIYSKLSVNGRWNAVARAEEINILPSR